MHYYRSLFKIKLGKKVWIMLALSISIALGIPARANSTNFVSPLPVTIKIKLDTLINCNRLDTFHDEQEQSAEQGFSYLSTMVEDNVNDKKYKRIMLHLLRKLKVKRSLRNDKFKAKLYYDLANISAKMKLYPLAMQFCYQETQDTTTAYLMPESIADTGNNPDELDSIFKFSTKPYYEESQPVDADDILNSFDDNKEASNYALLIHVKQPIKGKRKAFTGIGNVGHMFITLIKYNSDHSYVSRTFGFYPGNKSLLLATPLRPTTSSTFKDDALHDWDEAAGKFISYRRFSKIIKLLKKYQSKLYNLNENNCTDFGLSIATLSGIQINDTKGKWPFGEGNNPANAGQSILENKATVSTGELPTLFVFKN